MPAPLRSRSKPVLIAAGTLGLVAVVVLSVRFFLPARETPPAEQARASARGRAERADPGAGLAPAPAATNAVSRELTASALVGEAQALSRRLLERFPNDAGALDVEARVEYWLGRSRAAEQTWQRCVTADPRRAGAYIGMGTVAADRGEHERAAALFRKAFALDPGSTKAKTELAGALLKLGRVDEAIAHLEKAVAASPSSAFALYQLGVAYLQKQEYARARAYYEAALEAQPDWDLALYGLVTVWARLGERERSQEYLERFEVRRAEEAQMRKGVRLAYDDLGLMRQDVAETCTIAAQLYSGRGELEEAERLLQRAAAVDPANAICRRQLVALYGRSGRMDAAGRLLEEIVAIAPGDPVPRVQLGALYASAGDFEGAEQAFRDAIAVAPDACEGHRDLARLFVVTGRRSPEAATLARRAVELQPSAENYAILAVACDLNDDRDAALAAIEKALQLDPENAEFAHARDQLRRR